MKEIPVLFNGAMVRAILDDRKTQTRRIIKPQPVHVVPFIGRDDKPTYEFGLCMEYERVITQHVRSPLGKPGDRLWVRETIKRHEHLDGPWHSLPEDRIDSAYYAADHEVTALDYWPWKRPVLPAIHCPRGLSRLSLDVLDVRIERLQDISEEDALAEGFGSRAEFLAAWASIYGQESVDANHWVFATTFRKVP